MNPRLQSAIATLILVFVLISSSLFVVDERKFALVRQFGEVKYAIKAPGLYAKWPFVQNVLYFDKRVQTIDGQEPERFLTAEKKNVLVDSYVKWRIVDPKLYYISVSGDEARARIRLSQTINDGLRGEFGKGTVKDVIAGKRDQIMQAMRGKANEDAKSIGVEVLDVRVKRVELPQEVASDVYRRMEAERTQVASKLRAEGEREAEKIRADADRTRAVTLANAYSKAQGIKGQGDAEAAAIYAKAFSQNPEFYAFYRSLEAYRNTFKSKNDVLVLEPNSDFFKYLKSAQ
ncbi:MAG: protease modulator HflC [Zoogloeaceae bacterium]|jgi:membrane protease subunit HflC|nr:protease modulator HflC [Zoogloeaceae bacterium]